jgi:hypothetical protein
MFTLQQMMQAETSEQVLFLMQKSSSRGVKKKEKKISSGK